MNVNNKILITIKFDGVSMTLPVNPSEITISRSASNQNIDIVGLGKATRKGEPGLITTKIKSFFPSKAYPFISSNVIWEPTQYINFIEKIWNTENTNNRVARLYTKGLDKDFNMWFVIESFNYTYQAGDMDVSYDLSIKEYIPYGVGVQTEEYMAGNVSARPVSAVSTEAPVPEDNNPTLENKTYIVKSGDTLWGITKRCTGNGGRWKELYDVNKVVVGENPNRINVGQVLVLPQGWTAPVSNKVPVGDNPKKKKIEPYAIIPKGWSKPNGGGNE